MTTDLTPEEDKALYLSREEAAYVLALFNRHRNAVNHVSKNLNATLVETADVNLNPAVGNVLYHRLVNVTRIQRRVNRGGRPAAAPRTPTNAPRPPAAAPAANSVQSDT